MKLETDIHDLGIHALALDDRPAELTDANCGTPRDAVETRLTRIWETSFGKRPIGRGDCFFDLGGDSFIASSIFAQIEEQFGRHMPAVLLNERPTIALLSDLLRNDLPARLSPLAALQPGCGSALFCLPGIHGSLWELRKLVSLLRLAGPAYGLQPPGMDGQTPPHDTIGELAAYYLNHIRRAQPQGPYHLLGFSLGGMVAYEIAQQAHAAGERAGFLGLLNAPVRGLSKMVRQMSGAVKKLGPPPSLPCSPEMIAAHKRAFDAYQRKPYPGHLTLFQSVDDQPLFKRWFYGATRDWAESAALSEVHIVPGDHGGVFQHGNIEVFAATLRQCLAKWKD